MNKATSTDPARMQAAAEALATGKHRIDVECSHCHSPRSRYFDIDDLNDSPEHKFVDADLRRRAGLLAPEYFTCFRCGHKTSIEEARRTRALRIQQFISEGLDP